MLVTWLAARDCQGVQSSRLRSIVLGNASSLGVPVAICTLRVHVSSCQQDVGVALGDENQQHACLQHYFALADNRIMCVLASIWGFG